MAKCVDIKKAWDFGVLCDWFINSIDETEPPCWTPEHIEELLDGFYVIPKRKEIAAPVFDAEPVMQWISVKDRLPEKDGEYLVFTEQRDCFNALFESEIGDGGEFGVWLNSYHPDTLGFLDSEWQEYEGITHWMPLPEPPEEG